MPPSRRCFLELAKSLAPLIEREANGIEKTSTLTAPVLDAMRETDLFWFMLPAELGGGGADVTTAIEVMEELTRADGSTGWSFMANTTGTAAAVAYIGDQGIDAMFVGGKRPIVAGMAGPGGKAVEVNGGYRGGGNYKFGSGCAHADWISAGMFVMEDGVPRKLADGTPEVRVAYVPRERVVFKGNWDVIGLVGTGSYDYELPDQFVPAGLTMERTAVLPARGGAMFQFGIAGLGCVGHSAIALGLMKRALEEVARLSSEKKRVGYPGTVSEYPVFRSEFMKNEALYWAARGFVLDVFARTERAAEEGSPDTAQDRARFRQAVTWSTQVAAEVVQFCHIWGASESIRKPTALGRCLQDVHVATQHVFVDPITLVNAAPPVLDSWMTKSSDTLRI